VSASLTPPFVASDRGDIDVFPTLEAMASHTEVYDLDGYEFFDAAGRPIPATADGYSVRLTPDEQSVARPERLEELLRSYFARLPEPLAEFAAAALQAKTLHELVELRTRLEHRPR
jgi:hypothetical protein